MDSTIYLGLSLQVLTYIRGRTPCILPSLMTNPYLKVSCTIIFGLKVLQPVRILAAEDISWFKSLCLNIYTMHAAVCPWNLWDCKCRIIHLFYFRN